MAIAALGFAANKVQAQTTPALKIGVFDIDQVTQYVMQSSPDEYKALQAKMESYQRDSLGPQRDNYELQYRRADSTYQADSLAKKPKATLDYERGQVQQLYLTLANWSNTVQQASQNKYGELTRPYYEKVGASYKKVVAASKVNLVLSPQAIFDVPDSKVLVNLNELVLKDLGVKLPTDSAAGGK
ncbi:hypothetical protein A9P82_15060 [Arachidicoccus ginsenosidimutans]|nr:hypothetical protein A9P82_15060 [Arachidicoccus sp. BS20]